ncbi:hypothetical protein CPB84DRAFT_875048 [Gymnopilus junonius]|uniref:F-box domain-containing protein n=1 Tax=Gymnopilus junonius TaxID=109634 RepID=A0A9P5NPN7_GYMJU|nr:hypothetical protein CPB84DRAFT_875048 [Gymnopilus junonius]
MSSISINSLPPEILSLIFYFYFLGFGSVLSSRDRRERKSLPFRLGAVCRRWREVSCTTHVLWTRVYIHPTNRPSHPTEKEHFLQFVQEWLKRSGQLPLSITFRFLLEPGHFPGEHTPHIRALVGMIKALSNRWSQMELDLDPAFLPLWGGPAVSAPELLGFPCNQVTGMRIDLAMNSVYWMQIQRKLILVLLPYLSNQSNLDGKT